MKICSVCQREITPAMVRHGRAISRGAEVLHRECHSSSDRIAKARPIFGDDDPVEATMAAMPAAAVPASRTPLDGMPANAIPPVDGGVVYASFGRRLAAHMIDSLILGVLTAIILFPLGASAVLQGGQAGSMSPIMLLANVASILIPVIYCVVYWSKSGATPGKKAMGIRVVSARSGLPSGTQSLVRYLGYILSSLPLCLGYAWMIWDREHRCWHDILSGTRVIRV